MPLLVSDPAGLPALARPAAVRRDGARAARRRGRPSCRGLPRVARRARRFSAACPSSSTASPSPTSPGRAPSRRTAVADLWPGAAGASARSGAAGPEPEGLFSRRGRRAATATDPARARARGGDRARGGGRVPPGPDAWKRLTPERPPLRPARDLRPRTDLRGGGTERLVAADLAKVSAAGWIAERACRRSPFRIALTGGTTPQSVYERLAELDLDRAFVARLVERDERVVPPEHLDWNERLAHETPLPLPPVPKGQSTRCACSRSSCRRRSTSSSSGSARLPHGVAFPRLRGRAGRSGAASLRPELGLPPLHPRLSFSLAYLNAQPLVAPGRGEQARDPGLSSPETMPLPAARVQAAQTVVLADEAAASATGYLARARSILSPTARTRASSPGRAASWREAGGRPPQGRTGGRARASRSR